MQGGIAKLSELVDLQIDVFLISDCNTSTSSAYRSTHVLCLRRLSITSGEFRGLARFAAYFTSSPCATSHTQIKERVRTPIFMLRLTDRACGSSAATAISLAGSGYGCDPAQRTCSAARAAPSLRKARGCARSITSPSLANI